MMQRLVDVCAVCEAVKPCGCDFLEHFPLVRVALVLAARMTPSEVSAMRQFFQMLDHWHDVRTS